MLLLEVVKIPTLASLAVVAVILTTAVTASWLRTRPQMVR
jgi:tellurite resistance protein TerC